MKKIFILEETTQLDGEEREFVSIPFFDKESAMERAKDDVESFECDYEDNDCDTTTNDNTIYCVDCYGNSIFCEWKEVEVQGKKDDFVAVSVNRYDVIDCLPSYVEECELTDEVMENLAKVVGEWLDVYGDLESCVRDAWDKLHGGEV